MLQPYRITVYITILFYYHTFPEIHVMLTVDRGSQHKERKIMIALEQDVCS